MGKLSLGSMVELSHRLKAMEETKVLKDIDAEGDLDSDLIILVEDRKEAEVEPPKKEHRHEHPKGKHRHDFKPKGNCYGRYI